MHDVKALVGLSSIFEGLEIRLPSVIVCPLVQGFSLVPITGLVANELGAFEPTQADSIAPDMPTGLASLAVALSSTGPVAYISTEFFGGQGEQDAVVWEGGHLALTLSDATDKTLKWTDSPVSRALRSIGVVADAGKDEFDTVGLGRHRSTECWADENSKND